MRQIGDRGALRRRLRGVISTGVSHYWASGLGFRLQFTTLGSPTRDFNAFLLLLYNVSKSFDRSLKVFLFLDWKFVFVENVPERCARVGFPPSGPYYWSLGSGSLSWCWFWMFLISALGACPASRPPTDAPARGIYYIGLPAGTRSTGGRILCRSGGFYTRRPCVEGPSWVGQSL